MIPSILAWQLQKGMGDFVETSFPMTNEPFKGSLRKMTDTKGALYHDPYVSVRLPYRKAEEMPTCFEAIQMKMTPYVHQQKAFERLTGNDGKSTVIATGTGSGKTECFLYPILDYCYWHRSDKNKGIKAIIIYPMNALASDQARRIAGLIYNNPKLKSNVSCGLFVGGKDESSSTAMTETDVISDHETLLKYPPDILLTNYKMLDYLLVRPQDAKLWQYNDPRTLKYIAVDELHTFDGAQGTDLACLIRRVKKRLNIEKGYLCCIGTSATMGSGDDSEKILNYAEQIFNEPFEKDSVITEDRLTSDEFFVNSKDLYSDIPSEDCVKELERCINENDETEYLEIATRGWFPRWEFSDIDSDETRIELGEKLMSHETFRKVMNFADGRYVQNLTVADKFLELGKGDKADSTICSLYALISHARRGMPGRTQPFLNVSVQFWMKELRRFVGKVDTRDITYAVYSDLPSSAKKQYLPVVNCRECGATGWATLRNFHESNFELGPIEEFYSKYFNSEESSQILMAFPMQGNGDESVESKRYELCPSCLHYSYISGKPSGQCVICGKDTMVVDIPDLQKTTPHSRGQFVCPYCGSRRGLTLMGLRETREISAMLSQVFASKYNDDKKVLAFSDSVQDAAHKAGFFNSRTWKYSLRSSVQLYCGDEGDGKSLHAFQDDYIKHIHKEHPKEEEFVGYFTAPNMTWRHSYENTVKDGKWKGDDGDKKFMEELECRLRYEIMLEYGLSGNYGKSLEKTGCSVLSFKRDDMVKLADSVDERARNELGVAEDRQNIFNMCIGVLITLKSNGAFVDPVFNPFFEHNCNTYELSNDRNRWLPGLQSGRNTPRFYCKGQLSAKTGAAQLDTNLSPRYRSWIRDCAKGSFGKVDKETFGQIVDIIIEEAVGVGIVVEAYSKPDRIIYGINKNRIYVSSEVKQVRCSKCGATFAISAEDAEFWTGAPCRRHSCSGTLTVVNEAGDDYFGKLYRNGDFYKINAKEHTGLLEKEEREVLETGFKRHDNRNSWDPNVLSCTPTLEMGIDVGDLSTVVLCNIPPAQSQFTQRAGRAGRTDGNALTIAVANSRPREMYFYEDPLDMIDGKVEPPRIFLEASAVLERQLTAFCMDTWVRDYGDRDLIPSKVGQILDAVKDNNTSVFPYNFLKYVDENKESLFDRFAEMLDIDSEHSCYNELSDFIGITKSDIRSMELRIVDAFQVLVKQVQSLHFDIDELKKRIDELKAKPKDKSFEADIDDAENERKALSAVIRGINNKNVFNFLSDEGILPNYAFPEAGVILRAVLYRKENDDGSGKGYETIPYEYARSASAAISEFAPGNTFYVDGKKLTVDQLDINTSSIEKWRLCPECSYAELETSVSNKACCPRCGCAGWKDIGQVKNMIKVQTVYSNMRYDKTLIDDSQDDRTSNFYNKQLLVDVDTNSDVEKAYRISSDKYDFGYEFDKKATIRDVNFGPMDSVGEKTYVAGNPSVKKGFTICKECGKVQPASGTPVHSFKCKYYHRDLINMNAENAESPYIDCLYIYREFTTEALRLLIPFAAVDSYMDSTESFVAAFMLGMKEYFGNVDHLRATISNFPDQKTGIDKQYLTIYDSVPGGTGYLKQLSLNENSLMEIFEKALEKLKNCSCKDDPTKDGCYHCIYPYSLYGDIGGVSRKKAIEILETILSAKDTITSIKDLDAIPTNHICDSVLEMDFLAAIKKMVGDENFNERQIEGKVGYAINCRGNLWEIEPQVDLGPGGGVCVRSRPDFIIYPRFEGPMPVAVFTDGFVYHKDISASDTLKREAIRKSGKYRVWSLSYSDVDSYLKQWDNDYYIETLNYNEMPSSSIYNSIVKNGRADTLHPSTSSSLELLFSYLTIKDAESMFKCQAEAYSYSLLDRNLQNDTKSFEKWLNVVKKISDQSGFVEEDFKLKTCLYGEWTPRFGHNLLKVYAGTDTSKKSADRDVVVCAVLDDTEESKGSVYEKDWNGFLKFCDVMQFSKSFIGVSKEGVEGNAYSVLKD